MSNPSSTAPDTLATGREVAIAEEQKHLDHAHRRRAELIESLDARLSASSRDVDTLSVNRTLARQRAELLGADSGLIFGRLDSLDGTVWRIGRIGIAGDAHDAGRLVIDWRAPAARPFYLATPVEPLGHARRRHIRIDGRTVTNIDDEPLDGSTATELVGEGALLAALGERRTGKMTSAAATLQREQDEIVRADVRGPLVVQGGPGTGKTVVALHRAAYLLFANQQLADQGVLTLGPSRRFLDYIAQVLPALGETAIVGATPDELIPGVTVTESESRDAEEIKGRALWQSAIARYVESRIPEAVAVEFLWEGERYEISAPTLARLIATATSSRSYHAAQRWFSEQLHERLAGAVADRREAEFSRIDEGLEDVVHLAVDFEKVDGGDEGSELDGVLSDDELEELREKISEDARVAALVDALWPDLDFQREVRRLLAADDLLSRFAPELTPAERELARKRRPGWASADIPLLDAMADLLGDTEAPLPDEGFLASRAAARRDWVYGHVIVDEAQELSEMQWHMVARRTPRMSITAVGDIDQAEAPHTHSTWAQAVGAVFGERWTQAELTIGYRTPIEIMALTGPVLRKAGSLNDPPNAVRHAGIDPWELEVSERQLADEVARLHGELAERWAGGTVGVIAAAPRVPALREALAGIPVITATDSKGLEWDAALVVDEAGIAAEPRGWNKLYVALTRSTQELGRISVR